MGFAMPPSVLFANIYQYLLNSSHVFCFVVSVCRGEDVPRMNWDGGKEGSLQRRKCYSTSEMYCNMWSDLTKEGKKLAKSWRRVFQWWLRTGIFSLLFAIHFCRQYHIMDRVCRAAEVQILIFKRHNKKTLITIWEKQNEIQISMLRLYSATSVPQNIFWILSLYNWEKL